MAEEIVDLGHATEAGLRNDGLANALTGMGSGRDKSQYTYTKPITFLMQEELEGLYGEWLPRRIIDIYAEQATRKGFKVLFGGEGAKAEEVAGVEQVIEDLYILESLMLASKNSRLYGGAVILMYIDDGRAADQPVDKNNIYKVEGLEVLDRYQIAPVINEENIYDYSKATYYQIISGDLIRQPQLTYIHKDRILRFDGDWLPYRIRQRNYGWGMSNLQVIYDSFRHYWTGLNSAATLLTEFDIFVHKIRGLASMLAAGKEGQVRDRLVLNDMSKSIYRGYAIDAEKEELNFESRNLGGIGDILEKLRIDIIGASKIPHTLLFGESPGGLGSTGRSEERDFAKTLADYQTAVFKRPLKQLMEYILLSKTGPTNGRLPESWRVHFNDLYELNEREKADVRARVAAVDGRYIQLGVLHPKEVADARYGGSEWNMELTLDPSLPRELPMQGQSGGQSKGQGGMAVPPGGRDPLNEENGTLPMDGSREVADSAGLFLEGDLEEVRGDVKFADKSLHQQAIAAAKAKFKVWPSAYASAYMVKQYKELYKRKHGSSSGAFSGKDGEEVHADDLAQWFKEEWVRIGANGEILGECGGREEKEGKPKCLPKAKAEAMSKEERQTIVARKRKSDPDPDRKGAAKMVSSKVDANDPSEDLHATQQEKMAADSIGPYLYYNSQTVSQRKQSFVDDELYQQAVEEAKSKFTTYPSSYSNVYVAQKYNDLYKRKYGTMQGAFRAENQTFKLPKNDAIEPMEISGLLLSDYDEAALVNQADIDAALNEWKEEAPERFKDILEAEDVKP